MALVICKECGGNVSTKAKSCPGCGAEIRKKTSIVTWILAILFVISAIQMLIGLIVNGGNTEIKEDIKSTKVTNISLVPVAKKLVENRLKDPDSSEFRNVRDAKNDTVCGEVNAKNSFGGYSGYKRFVVGGDRIVVIENDIAAAEFEKIWTALCK